MSSNLFCKHCEKVLFCDFENYKTFEGTFCFKLKKENPNCENCKELKEPTIAEIAEIIKKNNKGEQNGEKK